MSRFKDRRGTIVTIKMISAGLNSPNCSRILLERTEETVILVMLTNVLSYLASH